MPDLLELPVTGAMLPGTGTDRRDVVAAIPVETMQVGRRYIRVLPGSEHLWAVACVSTYRADYCVRRDGRLVEPLLVTVHYRNGRSITLERGTLVAIECDEPTIYRQNVAS